MTNFQRTASWLAACGKEPTPANLSLQIGCDFEEQVEFLECVMLADAGNEHLLRTAIYNLRQIGNALKKGHDVARIGEGDRVNALDALCDREVTGNGVAYFAGFNKDGADQAVLASNDAKLVDGKPVLLLGGKIGKPEGWTAPDLSNFI